MIIAYKKLNIVYYKDNDVIILRIGLNVCLSNVGKYHSHSGRKIIQGLSVTLTNQSLYMPVNQLCWLTMMHDSDPCRHMNIFIQVL